MEIMQKQVNDKERCFINSGVKYITQVCARWMMTSLNGCRMSNVVQEDGSMSSYAKQC